MGQVTPLHMLITGVSGYLGRAVAEEALARGHRVTGIYRRTMPEGLECTLMQADLATVHPADLELDAIDTVIATAGELTGEWAVHERSTLPATRTTCVIAQQADAHLVHVSSITVYDYLSVPAGGTVTETTSLETHPEKRDGYVAAKLEQERIISDVCSDASILRLGALTGPGRAWNAHLGMGLGPALISLGRMGQIPTCDVERAAIAVVHAAERRHAGNVNLIDHDLPDRARFLKAFRKSGWPKLVLPLSWRVLDLFAPLLGRLPKAPGLFRRAVLHARMKPVSFDPSHCDAALGPLPKRAFETILQGALQDV